MKRSAVLGLFAILGVVFLARAEPTESTQNAAPTALATATPVAISAATIQSQPDPAPTPAVIGAPDPADRQVYFGEQHMHTRNSFDGYTIAPLQTWEAAYRYGMGEPITLESTGKTIQRRTPYDFVAITDHSEYYGVLKDLVDPNSPLSQSDFAKGFAAGMKDPSQGGQYVTQLIGTLLTNDPMQEYITPDLLMGNWAKFIETADRFNKPGEFTTLYAYEWTSIPNGQNMHRNVFFREEAPVLVVRFAGSRGPVDLPGGPAQFRYSHLRDPAQRQRLRRLDVLAEQVPRRADRRALCPAPAAERAAVRDRSNQGPVGRPPRAVPER
jgi:hypothetical protein